jgi:hypothetical protein
LLSINLPTRFEELIEEHRVHRRSELYGALQFYKHGQLFIGPDAAKGLALD